MLFSKNMSDFEKLQFTEDYIKVLKSALREKERNEEQYKQAIQDIIEEFKEANPKYKKISAYKREMKAHIEKTRKATINSERLERKNFALRQKVRELKAELDG